MGGRNGRLVRLFIANPHCYYCGKLTVLDGDLKNPLRATREHLFPKLHPRRTEPNTTNEQRIVLACNACNNAKCNTDVSDYLTDEQIKLRSMGKKNRESWMNNLLADIKRFDCFG